MGGPSGVPYVPDLCGTCHLTSSGTIAAVRGSAGEPGMNYNGSTAFHTGAAVVTSLPFTLAAWCRPTATVNLTVMDIGNTGNTNAINRLVANGGGTWSMQFRGSNTANCLASSSAVTSGALTHVGGSVDASTTASVWVNGGSKGTASVAATTMDAVNVTAIGALRRTTNAEFFAGDIFECCAWNVAQSDAFMAALADPGTRFELWYPLRSRKWISLGASSFNPAWALNSNQLLSGGYAA